MCIFWIFHFTNVICGRVE
ncbi:hypothetical protein M8C21_006285 [Ambrosia artemisiifolia]|uniref:Uncharacterized protein n=1 Tax=Ambrosia artemisiifolia TaxID=4212 RepID=A0AAD5CWC5_AMBAR|nr:hypothetical protein M8C21_006285 [Ambrosia artemisiifolia]